jgi:hypothetical protein
VYVFFSGEQQELMLHSGQTTNDLDPFLSCSSSNVDHSRQESADSGLGLGNNYSLPHTPEDFLSSNMDDNMDCTSGKNYKKNSHVIVCSPTSSSPPSIDLE